jgi:hypothetical protein
MLFGGVSHGLCPLRVLDGELTIIQWPHAGTEANAALMVFGGMVVSFGVDRERR